MNFYIGIGIGFIIGWIVRGLIENKVKKSKS